MAGSWELGGCIHLMISSVFSQWGLRISHLEKNGTLRSRKVDTSRYGSVSRDIVGVVSSDSITVVYGYPQERDGVEYLQ
eukprot:5476062-Prymnesium_polylepis.1